VYVCHRDDLSILYLSLRCLNKNWRGPKNLLIINEDGNSLLQDVISKALGTDWNVQIAEPPEMKVGEGWTRQQVCKLYAGNIVTTDWQIMLDSKNLMIKETCLSDFITEHSLLLVGSLVPDESEWDSNIRNMSRQLVNGRDTGIYPRCLTPWVFNTALTRALWNEIRPDTITNWIGSEFYIYWFYSNCKFKYNVQFPITGSLGGHILSLSHNVPDDIIFWNLHRYGTSLPEVLMASITYLMAKNIITQDDLMYFFILLYQRPPIVDRLPVPV